MLPCLFGLFRPLFVRWRKKKMKKKIKKEQTDNYYSCVRFAPQLIMSAVVTTSQVRNMYTLTVEHCGRCRPCRVARAPPAVTVRETNLHPEKLLHSGPKMQINQDSGDKRKGRVEREHPLDSYGGEERGGGGRN